MDCVEHPDLIYSLLHPELEHAAEWGTAFPPVRAEVADVTRSTGAAAPFSELAAMLRNHVSTPLHATPSYATTAWNGCEVPLADRLQVAQVVPTTAIPTSGCCSGAHSMNNNPIPSGISAASNAVQINQAAATLGAQHLLNMNSLPIR